MEREVERQRQLDIERAKSRELQFNLDLEKEKQTQVPWKFVLDGHNLLALEHICATNFLVLQSLKETLR
jgi:hypothetical protein